MFEKVNIVVGLACNNPRNGHFAEVLYGLNVGANMTFDPVYGDHFPRLRYISDASKPYVFRAIALSGKHFAITGHHNWAGNWCRDEVQMPGAQVLALLNWPGFRRWFSICEGETRLFHLFKAGHEFTDDDLRLIAKDFG